MGRKKKKKRQRNKVLVELCLFANRSMELQWATNWTADYRVLAQNV